WRTLAARKSANTPVSAPLSTSDTRLPRAAPSAGPLISTYSLTPFSRNGVSAASPFTARPYSLRLPEAMPAIQSSPSTRYGATPASDTAAAQRSGNNAAHARARGPPPDQPLGTNPSA